MIENKIIETAYSYIGQEETKNNSGFKDSEFYKKMLSIGWKKGWAWCSLFAELVWKESYNDFKIIAILDKLFSASTQKTFSNFSTIGKKFGFTIHTTAQPGDLIIWQSKKVPWQGHAAIVVEVLNDGRFITIEGNTNKSGGREGEVVAKKTRTYNEKSYKLKGFIRPIEIL